MFIDHDCDDIRIDTESLYKGTGKLFNNCAFLVKGKTFSHFYDYYGHDVVHRYPELWVKPVFSITRYEIVTLPDTAHYGDDDAFRPGGTRDAEQG